MKFILTKINCFILCFCLIFSIVISDYKRVSAMDWVVTQVTSEIALPFLMGLLGVAYVSTDGNMGARVNEDEFFSYAEQQNIPGVNVRAWLSDVCTGTLNQASEVWTCFKSWVNSFKNDSVTITHSNINSLVSSFMPNLTSITYTPSDVGFSDSFFPSKGIYWKEGTSSSSRIHFYFFNDFADIEFGNNYILFNNLSYSTTDEYFGCIGMARANATSFPFQVTQGERARVDISSSYDYYIFGADSIPETLTNVHVWDIPIEIENLFGVGTGVTDLDNLDLLDDDATSTSIPGVLPLPWDQVGTSDTAISDTLSGLIEQVQEGVLSIDDYIATLQDLIGVITVDTTSDVVIPVEEDPTTGEDITSDDIVNENINNAGFVLGGLEKVFPFCLPYDLYNFVTILVAEPVAPVINFPIYNPANGQTENIEIDFSEWQSIVILFRYIFDFLFIIGLILISRALIGGGDKA